MISFPQRLAERRKQHSLTQRQLTDRIGMHVVQVRRYEAGTSQPRTSGPDDDDLRLQFAAVSRFDAEEKQVVRSVLKGMILKHEARRWQRVSNGERK